MVDLLKLLLYLREVNIIVIIFIALSVFNKFLKFSNVFLVFVWVHLEVSNFFVDNIKFIPKIIFHILEFLIADSVHNSGLSWSFFCFSLLHFFHFFLKFLNVLLCLIKPLMQLFHSLLIFL